MSARMTTGTENEKVIYYMNQSDCDQSPVLRGLEAKERDSNG
jgi:hypothetical protein